MKTAAVTPPAKSMFAARTARAAALWLLTGCAAPTTVAAPQIEAAYEVSADGRLRVRPDVWDRLTLLATTTTELRGELVGLGRLEFAPDAAYAVRVPFPAYVESVRVTAGARVQTGDTLATLRSGEVARLRSEVRRLNATLSARRDAVARYQRLVHEGAGSPRELVQAQADLAESEAELRGVREGLRAVQAGRAGADRFVLRATASGQVLQRFIDPGERIAPEDIDPAFLIGDAGRLVAVAGFPERDAVALRDGGACSFVVPALGSLAISGNLMQVVQTVDRDTRTASAVCVPRAPDPRLRGEMAARVQASVVGEDALVVPRGAVLLRRDEFVVFVVVGERLLERRGVTLGTRLGGQVEVLAGLEPGERVVVDNAVLLDGELDLLL